jgi:hypothetical protein
VKTAKRHWRGALECAPLSVGVSFRLFSLSRSHWQMDGYEAMVGNKQRQVVFRIMLCSQGCLHRGLGMETYIPDGRLGHTSRVTSTLQTGRTTESNKSPRIFDEALEIDDWVLREDDDRQSILPIS